MLTAILSKEFLEMRRDGRFRAAALAVLLLLLATLGAGAKYHHALKAERERAQRVQREQWLGQGEKGPHSAAHYGLYAFKPAMPLSLADRGVEPYVGVAVWIEAHKQNDLRFAPAQDAVLLQRFGDLTAAFVLQLLVPLLIIVVAFGAFAGERERGTLRLALAQGVSVETLAVGKALGIAACLGLLLVPASLVGALALIFTGNGGALTAGETAARALLMAAAYLLYFGMVLGVALAVSARASSSRAALIALLAWWVGSCLVLPRLAVDAARHLYPAPSALAFHEAIADELERGPDGHSSRNRRSDELKARVLREYGVTRLDDLPVAFEGIALQESEEWGYRVFDKHYGNLRATFDQQERVHQWMGIFAPLLSVRAVSMGMAETDRRAHQEFGRAAEEYRRILIRIINDDIKFNARTGDTGYVNGRVLYEKVPPFTYRARNLAMVAGAHLGDIALLTVGFVAAWLLAWRGARTMQAI
jgi:ABC-2 type transport system permease protein